MLVDYTRNSIEAYDAYYKYALTLNELDYFDFPSSAIAFAESLSSSNLASIENEVWFRHRNKSLTLLSYSCNGSKLLNYIVDLQNLGFAIKSLNFVNKDFTNIKLSSYGKEYYVNSDYSLNSYLCNKHGKELNMYKRAMNRGELEFELDLQPSLQEVLEVFNSWAVEASKRHFMVVKGHYLRYIQRYYEMANNVNLVGFRNKSTGILYGIIGFEVFNNQAQLTLAKHITGLSYFPKYMWITAIASMLSKGVTKAFCGTTADELKSKLNMLSSKSYKIMYS